VQTRTEKDDPLLRLCRGLRSSEKVFGGSGISDRDPLAGVAQDGFIAQVRQLDTSVLAYHPSKGVVVEARSTYTPPNSSIDEQRRGETARCLDGIDGFDQL